MSRHAPDEAVDVGISGSPPSELQDSVWHDLVTFHALIHSVQEVFSWIGSGELSSRNCLHTMTT